MKEISQRETQLQLISNEISSFMQNYINVCSAEGWGDIEFAYKENPDYIVELENKINGFVLLAKDVYKIDDKTLLSLRCKRDLKHIVEHIVHTGKMHTLWRERRCLDINNELKTLNNLLNEELVKHKTSSFKKLIEKEKDLYFLVQEAINFLNKNENFINENDLENQLPKISTELKDIFNEIKSKGNLAFVSFKNIMAKKRL